MNIENDFLMCNILTKKPNKFYYIVVGNSSKIFYFIFFNFFKIYTYIKKIVELKVFQKIWDFI